MDNIFNKINFEEKLGIEILKAERMKATLLLYVFILLAFFSIVISTLFVKEIDEIFGEEFTPTYVLSVIFLFLALREFNIRILIKKLISRGKKIKVIIRYINTFIEASIPTIMIIIMLQFSYTVYLFSSPMILLYLVFIFLTTLSLDYKISIFSGVVASTEFLILLLFVLNDQANLSTPIHNLYFYLGKIVLILISGFIAGFIADRLRKNIYNTYNQANERNAIVNLFNQQVSKEIVDELIDKKENLESLRKFVCIMFLDIRGFTHFAEKKQPEEIIKFQNDVFGFMIEIITQKHGIINQFLGDGYMATFGAPLSQENDCQNAFDAAVEIINTLNKKNQSGEIPLTKIGIGLHAGYVVAGNVGTSIRKQYSISGNTVILSSRIEQLNKRYDSQLLISHEVFEKINGTKINIENIGPVQVKGREKPITIYKVL
ncbi:MAG: adenylate/guanylate cyclase domain-containing protein [Ignavibacteria bacterium]|jgi:adenylate cyclase